MTEQEFRAEFPVILKQDLAWGDMDAFQHINNCVYFRYFENVRLEYFGRVGVIDSMKESNVGPILGATECRYLAPLTYPDSILVGTRVSKIREKRFSMRYEIFSTKLNKVVAVGSGEIVYFDFSSGQSCAIPEKITHAMSQLN